MGIGIECGETGEGEWGNGIPCAEYPALGTHDWDVFCTSDVHHYEKHSITAEGGSILVVMDSAGH